MCDMGVMATTDVLWENYPVARKKHVCCECGSDIRNGDRYELIKGVWDGEFNTFKTCSFCSSVRERARYDFDLNSDEGFTFGQLWECVGMDYAGKAV